jgi:hypothetical protein
MLSLFCKSIDIIWNGITVIGVRYYVSWNNLYLYVHVERMNV